MRTQLPLLAVLGVAVSFGSWFLRAPPPIPFALVILAGFVAVMLIFTLWNASFEAFTHARKPLPAVRSAKAAPQGSALSRGILLLDESDLFSQGTQVSIYLRDEADFEILIGLGFVAAIQSQGYVQVWITQIASPYEGTLRQIMDNNKQLLERVRVKPSVPTFSTYLPPLEP